MVSFTWLLCGFCNVDFPRSAFEVNVAGTFKRFKVCKNNGVKRLIHSSSASVYGDALEEPKVTEEHPFNNKKFLWGYKNCLRGNAAFLLSSLWVTICRPSLYEQVYGPRQDYHGAYIAVIMKMLDAIDKGEGPTIMGDGSEAFDFVAVEDCGLANLCAIKGNAVIVSSNVGTGKRISLERVGAK